MLICSRVKIKKATRAVRLTSTPLVDKPGIDNGAIKKVNDVGLIIIDAARHAATRPSFD